MWWVVAFIWAAGSLSVWRLLRPRLGDDEAKREATRETAREARRQIERDRLEVWEQRQEAKLMKKRGWRD
jgi:hypothetical protein